MCIIKGKGYSFDAKNKTIFKYIHKEKIRNKIQFLSVCTEINLLLFWEMKSLQEHFSFPVPEISFIINKYTFKAHNF